MICATHRGTPREQFHDRPCGTAGAQLLLGAVAGIVGAVISTFGGRTVRAWMAATFGGDFRRSASRMPSPSSPHG
jgi:uncharacterized membrane protein